ncbi:MAG TPA: hypothetical protein VJL88_00670 [Nitrospira sp.]|nr:hypothetical protein [Nitrospira sp.]
MKTTAQNAYQLAGLDPRERGFSRTVDVVKDDAGYRMALRYEAERLVTAPADTEEAALQCLIATLHQQGYRQLKTQISFSNGAYLGSQESWIEYPDPAVMVQDRIGLIAAIRSWFHRERRSA